ncbi:hypothetical protein OIO90_003064 [Microbotryomycetes sp. JL221]|nr:hypothetical protein OIO90_003064 [Microbotryomycetes sp. JL221]
MDLPPQTPVAYQQRPSLSYFMFLTVLLFMMSNNGQPGVSLAERNEQLERMTNALHLRQAKREGLAQWLGVGNQTQWELDHTIELDNGTRVTSNETWSDVIKFELDPHRNDALVPVLQNLLEDEQQSSDKTMQRPVAAGQRFFAQNLTGFVRGDWTYDSQWSYAKLGLPEAYNTTEQRQKTDASDKDTSSSDSASQGTIPEPPSDEAGGQARMVVRRNPQEASNDAATTKNTTEVSQLVNVTVTTNRTEQRHDFPFTQGGKVSFNFREEQTSAVGPILPLTKDWKDGRLLEPRPGGANESWEEAGPITYLRGELTMTSQDGRDEVVLDIESVHFLAQGTVYGFVTPTWARSHLFDAVGLPAYDASAKANLSTIAAGHAVLKEVDRRIVRDKEEIQDESFTRDDGGGSGIGGGSGGGSSAPNCIFALYGALRPVPAQFSPRIWAEAYAELFHPTGSGVKTPPNPVMDYVLYSTNCGLVLHGQAEASSTSLLWNRATDYALLTGLSQLVILLLLVRQMERGGPGSTAKLAHTTVAVQAAVDAYFFIIHFTVGIVTANRASMPLLAPAFFALVSSLVFGMRFASTIRASAPPSIPRRPAPPPPPTQQLLAAQAAESRANQAGDDAAQTVPTSQRAAVETATEVSDLPFFLFGLAIAALLTSIVIIWGWLALLTTLVYSYWIPQIVLNVQRGAARQTLRRDYIIGTTIARLVLPVYFWGNKDNVLAVEPSHMEASIGGTIKPRDLIDSDNVHAKEDCPICLSRVQVAPSKQDEVDGVDESRLRWTYMVTPCNHIAHTECLEHWLEVKSQCPVCRARLPPL